MTDSKQINFTIVPGEPLKEGRTYANFCAIAHTPFDITLTFCEVLPLTEGDLQAAEATHVVHAPVRATIALPLAILPSLISALQEHTRNLSEQVPPESWGKGPVH
jgi:hypothetical protein